VHWPPPGRGCEVLLSEFRVDQLKISDFTVFGAKPPAQFLRSTAFEHRRRLSSSADTEQGVSGPSRELWAALGDQIAVRAGERSRGCPVVSIKRQAVRVTGTLPVTALNEKAGVGRRRLSQFVRSPVRGRQGEGPLQDGSAVESELLSRRCESFEGAPLDVGAVASAAVGVFKQDRRLHEPGAALVGRLSVNGHLYFVIAFLARGKDAREIDFRLGDEPRLLDPVSMNEYLAIRLFCFGDCGSPPVGEVGEHEPEVRLCVDPVVGVGERVARFKRLATSRGKSRCPERV